MKYLVLYVKFSLPSDKAVEAWSW